MTEQEKRKFIELSAHMHKMTLDIVCPPGTHALLFMTLAVGIPGLIFLFSLPR